MPEVRETMSDRAKGGQPVTACTRCFGLNMSCKTSEKVNAGRKETEGLEDDMGAKEEGKEIYEVDKLTTAKEVPGKPHRQLREAALSAKKCLEKYCGSYVSSRHTG